jgi:hypothetical protein
MANISRERDIREARIDFMLDRSRDFAVMMLAEQRATV